MIFKSRDELPATCKCLLCDKDKPLVEIIVVRHRKSGHFQVRPRCKLCHNMRERGHRREYKTKYLRRWRTYNSEVNESYWRTSSEQNREQINARAHARFIANHDAILIQGRLRRRAGMRVSLAEAKKLLSRFGRCYPTRYGLTPDGLKECERIRSRMRSAGQKVSALDIRMMVYEDGFYLKPSRQPVPYRTASNRLRRWQAKQRMRAAAA